MFCPKCITLGPGRHIINENGVVTGLPHSEPFASFAEFGRGDDIGVFFEPHHIGSHRTEHCYSIGSRPCHNEITVRRPVNFVDLASGELIEGLF